MPFSDIGCHRQRLHKHMICCLFIALVVQCMNGTYCMDSYDDILEDGCLEEEMPPSYLTNPVYACMPHGAH
jgi:hypothetical protein